MFSLDTTAKEHILECLEAGGYLFPQYKFWKLNNRMQLLGKGGFSSVYEMIAEGNPKNRYALKVIGFEKYTVTSEEFWQTTELQRFLGEQSSNIVRIIDRLELRIYLDKEGKLQNVENALKESVIGEGVLLQFILMEKQEHVLVKDRFGNTIVAREELLEEKEVIRFAQQVGNAIFAAHNNKILHRDIKLENIFWNEKEQQYELGDFEIAKYAEDGNAETVLYTDGYGAPEIQRKFSEHYTITADIYSFGISLYVLLNDLKFPGSGGYYMNLVQYSPEFIFPAPRNASGELTRIVRKMCNYSPEERYQSMLEVLEDLNRLEKGVSDEEKVYDMEELPTETYRDTERKWGDILDNKGIKINRIERKEQEKEKEKAYNRLCVCFAIVFPIFLVMMLKGVQVSTEFVISGEFWILPVIVLLEAVLQRFKEFYIIFGFATLILLGYSMYLSEGTVVHIVLIASVLSGVSVLTFSSAVGVGLWMWIVGNESLLWLNFIELHDLGWLAVAGVLCIVNKLMIAKAELGMEIDMKTVIWAWIYDKLSFLMIIAGSILLVLQHFDIIVIPEVIQRIHLVKTGILVYMCSYTDMEDRKEEVVEEDVCVEE